MIVPGLLALIAAGSGGRSDGGNATRWWRHAGVSCDGSHGAVDLESPSGSSLGSMALAECKRRCAETPTCNAVTIDVVRLEWAVHRGTNCYAGHGAVELVDGDGTDDSCFVMTLEECKDQCVLTPSCTGVEWDRSPLTGNCCLRANIDLPACDTAETWDLHEITVREPIPAGARPCRRRASVGNVGQCDLSSEVTDTFVLNPPLESPWWLSTHYAERSFMPRHYSCNPATPGKTCTLRELERLLPSVKEQGYTVVNVDWPIDASPDSLFEGFGARDYMRVDPALGTEDDWTSFVAVANRNGLKVVVDFNPSYFWTGALAFKEAVADVKLYGVGEALPASSPARWFRWTARCPSTSAVQPPDANPQNGVTDGWVRSPAAGGACYWSIWGVGQPCADLTSPEWQAELTKIVQHWVGRGVDGFMLDAPGFYLATPVSVANPISGLNDSVIAATIRKVIVEPAHALGAAVFGETYNLGRPPVNKVLDGGRNTDMPDEGNGGDDFPGFPSKVHAMVTTGNASGLEALLSETVDVLGGWSGGAVRTEPDSRGTVAIAGQKAAVTALLAGYYVVRMGPQCVSPHTSYPAPGTGDEWPGGCFGKWTGADAVALTLKALHKSPALRPGTLRLALNISGGDTRMYAALRSPAVTACNGTNGTISAAVVVFNFAKAAGTAGIELDGTPIVIKQPSTDLINGVRGPPLPATGPWLVALPANGWSVLEVLQKCVAA